MTGWKDTTIGKEIRLAYGKGLSTHERDGGRFSVFGSNGCVGHHSTALISGPGIIIGRKGSVGEVAFSHDNFWPIDTTYYVVNEGGHDWRFLFHLLSNVGLRKLNSHSAVPGLNREDVYSIEVSIPDLQEQRMIGQALDKVQLNISLEDEAITFAQSLKRAAMRVLFTEGLRGEAQKDTGIGLVPESWEPTSCEAIFKLTSGKTRPDDLNAASSDEKPYPVFGGNGVMGFSASWNVDLPEILLIGRVGEYCGAVHRALGKVWVTDNALYAKEWLLSEASMPFVGKFLEYYDLNRFKRMAGQPLVTQGMINEHFIPLPRPSEQDEIVAILDAIDRKIDLHKRKRTILNELFKTLMHKLMTSQIRVDDLDLLAIELVRAKEIAA